LIQSGHPKGFSQESVDPLEQALPVHDPKP
jgi:hypothetical protein